MQSVRKINNLAGQMNKFTDMLDLDLSRLKELPIFHAIKNRIGDLVKLQNPRMGIREAFDTLLLVDIESTSQLDRGKLEVAVKAGKLMKQVRTHLAFDPEYTVPRARALSVVKATLDIEYKFEQLSNPD